MAKKGKTAFDLETLLKCPDVTWDMIMEFLAGNIKSEDDIKKMKEEK